MNHMLFLLTKGGTDAEVRGDAMVILVPYNEC
jgi:hypothetical protein